VGDFDGLKGPDLAVGDFGGSDTVSVLLNDGAGGFTPAPGSPFPSDGGRATSGEVGDFDGLKGPDLAVASVGSDTVSVLLNDGAGGFTPAPGSPFDSGGCFPTSVAVGDFDGLKGPDLAVANSSSGTVSVLLNDGAGGFTPAPGSPFPS